ncbi:MAG: nucleoside triphosphate pyrophosphohydrolase [Gemmatimonadota bacterium]
MEPPPPPPPPGPDGLRFTGPGPLTRALELVRYLRTACPWDAEQTAESLIPHLLEETHEVVDAIRSGDVHALEGELGDLLLNLAFQIVVAEEKGDLDAMGAYRRLEEKMVARHPHLFDSGQKKSWAELKADERKEGERILDGLSAGLDPLTRAHRMQEKAAGVGFDWPDREGPAAKVREELQEVMDEVEAGSADRIGDEVGDLLFAAVNLARHVGTHPTNALARANQKFQARFTRLEELANERGLDMFEASLDELDALWDEVKREGQ